MKESASINLRINTSLYSYDCTLVTKNISAHKIFLEENIITKSFTSELLIFASYTELFGSTLSERDYLDPMLSGKALNAKSYLWVRSHLSLILHNHISISFKSHV